MRPGSDPSPPDLLARAAPGLFVVIWATGFVVARLVAPHAEPLTFLTARFVLTTIVLTGVAFAVGARWPRGGRGWRDALVAGALLQGLYLAGVFWSVRHGLTAGVAALIASLQPLLTGALAGPLLGERVGGRRWLGILIGFVGAGLVVAPKLGAGSDALPPAALGVCFLGMVAITLGTIWQKRTAVAVDLRTNAAAQFMGGTLVVLPLALLTERGRFDGALELWLGLAWAVLGLSIGGILILLGLIRRGAVAGVAALLYLVPPVAALMAYALFGETLAPLQLVGMAVAAAGVAVASRG